jgi:hypothetical protein
VEIWDVPALRVSDTYTDPVRVVRVRERWTEQTQQGNEWKTVEKEQPWIWVVAGERDAYNGAAIRDFGHLRWKIENNAFGELTQHWHLTHCAHHKPMAVLALLWIKIIASTLFQAFAIVHGKLFRLGKVTLPELRKRIYRSLLCGWPIRCLSGYARPSSGMEEMSQLSDWWKRRAAAKNGLWLPARRPGSSGRWHSQA